MSDSAAGALIGRRVAGKFLVEKRLGDGSMGAVYRAKDTSLERLVALKVMHPAMAVDPSFVSRFHREARAASRLDHPSSMRVIEFGEDPDGLLYIAMEYLEGRDLYKVMHEDWPLSDERIVGIMMQALSAVTMAHEMGVIHRDLKPENIMILDRKDDEGQDLVKVCDFGIAKLTDRDDEENDPRSPEHKVTTTGIVVGTPEYMSPEQARGERLDARSDLYAMGVILYQLLTGRTPFLGDTALSVVLKHISEPPAPPSTIYAEVHKGLERVCLKALVKTRDGRYQTAREMRGAVKIAMAGAAHPTSASDAPAALPPTLSEIPPAHRTQKLASTFPVATPRGPESRPPIPLGTSLATAEERRSRWPLALGAMLFVLAVAGLFFVLFFIPARRRVGPAPLPMSSVPLSSAPVSSVPLPAGSAPHLRRGGSRSSAR